MMITKNEWTCLLILQWSSTIWKLLQRLSSFLPDKTSSFKKNIVNNAPVRRITIAMNTTSAFIVSYTKNPFSYQQKDLRQITILKGFQQTVDFDAADSCRLYVTRMKAMNILDDIPSIPTDTSKDHFVLVFDLTSTQDATENSIYPKLVKEQTEAGAKPNFSSRTRYWTHYIGKANVFGCSWQIWCCWKRHLKRIMFLSSN